jgi:hypothetical protein
MANKVQVIFEIDKDAQGRTTLTQIAGQIRGLGSSAKSASNQIDAALAFTKSAFLIEFFRRGAAEAYAFAQAAVKAFNEAQNAALGLQSVARFKGIDPQSTAEVIRNLDLVKSGLLTVGDASTTVKNLLQAGFSLEQSIDLIKRFGDSAAFGRQGALSFGQAVVSTSEGIRNQNSILSDNGGITKNLSVILKERGFELQDLSDKIKGTAAREALYNGLLAETQAQVGDAAKLTKTFAGEQAQLEAAQNRLLVSLGELITKNPELNGALKTITATLEYFTLQLKDADSGLSQFANNVVSNFGIVLDAAGKLARGLGPILGAISAGFIEPINNVLNPGNVVFAPTQDEAQQSKVVKTQFAKLRELYVAEQKKIETQLKQQPILDAQSQQASDAAGAKATAEMSKAADAYFKKLEDSNKKFADNIKQVSDATADLQARLSLNPIGDMFDRGIQKQQEFLEKFKSVPEQMKEAFEKANRDALTLDLFKGVIGQQGSLNRLITDRAKISEGGPVFQQAALREARENQLRQSQELLSIATNAAQKQLALANILDLTSDTGSLSPTELDTRRSALDESIAIQSQVLKENFDRLEKQTAAQNDNTAALTEVGGLLGEVRQALIGFAENALTIHIKNESVAAVDLGRSFQ